MAPRRSPPLPAAGSAAPPGADDEENALAAAVRKYLPAGLADKARIQIIVQMPEDGGSDDDAPADLPPAHAPEQREECHSNSSP